MKSENGSEERDRFRPMGECFRFSSAEAPGLTYWVGDDRIVFMTEGDHRMCLWKDAVKRAGSVGRPIRMETIRLIHTFLAMRRGKEGLPEAGDKDEMIWTTMCIGPEELAQRKIAGELKIV